MTLFQPPRTVLITGGCGFIGHHVVEHIHRHTTWSIIVIDRLSYASFALERLREISLLSSPRVKVLPVDLTAPLSEGVRYELGEVDYIIHMAADTHVDHSIAHPIPFVLNNVSSTLHILEYARHLPCLKRMIYFSTDEVYGSAPGISEFKEWDRHRPTNPYSASKSCGEQLCVAYENTYKVPVLTVNVMNAFGERQHVEKYIPHVIRAIQRGETVQIHCDPTCTVPGSRFYIHARNIASAVLFVLQHGVVGDKYNIRGEEEVDNLQLAQRIAEILNQPLKYDLVNFHESRPGHDLRYALDGSKLYEMGWCPPVTFQDSLRRTIEWTLQHPQWLCAFDEWTHS
jgi:dTDP-glucose 4,6-dehydratase